VDHFHCRIPHQQERNVQIEHDIVCEGMPVAGRVNEDAYHFQRDENQITLLVADGAAQRLKTQQFQIMLAENGIAGSAASYAARLTAEAAANHPTLSPREILLQAKESLRDKLVDVYGDLTAEAILAQEPQLIEHIQPDLRLFRLALPVCVATVAQIDCQTNQLTYAHAGDTALFTFQKDGSVSEVTFDQMAHYDKQTLALVLKLQAEEGLDFDTAREDERVKKINRQHGLYHNYVDEDGQTDPELGVGAINGLPELVDYIEEGVIDLADVAGVVVCSDGFPWPIPWEETPSDKKTRLKHMRDLIERDGLRHYFEQLRAEEQADSARRQYPRLKVHDDVTGIYLRL
jgi:hypothetical protein